MNKILYSHALTIEEVFLYTGGLENRIDLLKNNLKSGEYLKVSRVKAAESNKALDDYCNDLMRMGLDDEFGFEIWIDKKYKTLIVYRK